MSAKGTKDPTHQDRLTVAAAMKEQEMHPLFRWEIPEVLGEKGKES